MAHVHLSAARLGSLLGAWPRVWCTTRALQLLGGHLYCCLQEQHPGQGRAGAQWHWGLLVSSAVEPGTQGWLGTVGWGEAALDVWLEFGDSRMSQAPFREPSGTTGGRVSNRRVPMCLRTHHWTSASSSPNHLLFIRALHYWLWPQLPDRNLGRGDVQAGGRVDSMENGGCELKITHAQAGSVTS